MTNWSLQAEKDSAGAAAAEDLQRRLAYSTRAACHLISVEYNAHVQHERLGLEVGESSFSGFHLHRADKKLRAIICTRPTAVEVQYIAGYRFDTTEHRVTAELYTVSAEGPVIFCREKERLTPSLLADHCCELILGYDREA